MAIATKLGPGKLSIGATEALVQLQSQVTKFELTPSASQDDPIKVMSGETVAGAFSETWKISVTFNTDLGETASVWEYLYNNSGTTQPFDFEPATSLGKKFTGSLVIVSAGIGGDVDTIGVSDAEFTVIGKPVMTDVA